MFSKLVLAVVLLTWNSEAAALQDECPCMYREADPLFPGAEGFRFDCEYVMHGLAHVPYPCWAAHPHVTQVFLDYNEITEVAQDSFAGLTNLKTLSLKHNKISSIDEAAFAGMDSLQYLDLSSNVLKSPPSQIWRLKGLTHLYLADNAITDATTFSTSSLVNLEVLDLHLNHLTELPHDSLTPLAGLRRLYLYWNMLTSLPDMRYNTRLEEVLVNGNALLQFPKHLFANLTQPLTYHFVDNPAYDVWAPMLLPLLDRSHIKMGNDVSVWAEDQRQAEELLAKDWLVQDGLSQTIDLASLVRVCGAAPDALHHQSRLPPC